MSNSNFETEIYELDNNRKIRNDRGCCCACISVICKLSVAIICAGLSLAASILFTTRVDVSQFASQNPTNVEINNDPITIAILVLVIGFINLTIRIIEYCYWYKKVGNSFDSESISKSRDSIFIAFTSFSDIIFDLIQALALYFMKDEYEVSLFVVCGTWTGFGSELVNFGVELATVFMDSCADCCYAMWVFGLIGSTVVEQGLGIYIALTTFSIPMLLYVATGLNAIVVIFGIFFLLKFCCKGCKYMH